MSAPQHIFGLSGWQPRREEAIERGQWTRTACAL